MKRIPILSIEALDFVLKLNEPDHFDGQFSAGEPLDFAVVLGGGVAFSRKTIYRKHRGRYHVMHHIDDTEQHMTVKELLKSNIGVAMKKGALDLIVYGT